MAKYINTRYPGVRYRVHKSRKNGVQRDRYFSIYYHLKGKRKDEGVGWATQGWSLQKAAGILAELKENQRKGEGPQTLAEKRELEQERRLQIQQEADKQKTESITFSTYFDETYIPRAELTKKPKTVSAEKGYFTNWLAPTLGNLSFKEIYPIHIEKVKSAMLKAEKAPRSVQYTLAIIRQVWNGAKMDGLVKRDSPTKEVKPPRIDNKRIRFLTHEEAQKLLANLFVRSEQLHNMSLLSLHTGMRAGEIFNLRWGDVDIEQGIIHIKDAKGGSGTAFMTDEVVATFKRMKHGRPNQRIFKGRNGKKIVEISNSFQRAVDNLGLNDDITDRRRKVSFHTLRHTFASWLVQGGEDLYTVQKLMRHGSIQMTERYAHLSPENLQSAMKNFQNNLQKFKKAKVVPLKKK